MANQKSPKSSGSSRILSLFLKAFGFVVAKKVLKTIRVTTPNGATSLALTDVNQSGTLKASPLDQNGKAFKPDPALTWVSSHPEFVQVTNAAGLTATVVGLAEGSSNITATGGGVASSAFTATVTVPVPIPPPNPTPVVNCAVSAWSGWSAWVPINANTEQRSRTRTVVTQPSGGGTVCPALIETEQRAIVTPGPSGVLIQSQDVVYLGAFLPPEAGIPYSAASGTLAFNAASGTLLMATNAGTIGEMTIPAPVLGTNYAALNRATSVHAPFDVLAGQAAKIDGDRYSLGYSFGDIIYDGTTLYLTINNNYDSTQDQHLSHFKVTSPFSSPVVTGPYQVGNEGKPGATFPSGGSPAGRTAGALVPIPAAYQASLGGDVLTGMGVQRSIIARSSYGPGTFAMTLADIQAFNATGTIGQGGQFKYASYGAFAPAIALLGYGGGRAQTLGGYDVGGSGAFPRPATPRGTANFSVAYGAAGACWPVDTRTLLFAATNGTPGHSSYGPGIGQPTNAWPNKSCRVYTVNGVLTPGPDCNVAPANGVATNFEWAYDPGNNSEGTHGYPYLDIAQVYDVDDLVAVRAGTKLPWEVVPYQTFTLPHPWANAGGGPIRGVAYDPATKRLYVAKTAMPVVFNLYYPPVVMVFQVGS